MVKEMKVNIDIEDLPKYIEGEEIKIKKQMEKIKIKNDEIDEMMLDLNMMFEQLSIYTEMFKKKASI